MIPSCDHTGTPNIEFDGFRHFTSSTTSGAASRISLRIRVSIAPRQSPGPLLFASLCLEGEAPAIPFIGRLSIFFIVFVASLVIVRSHSFARQLAGLLHPSGELSFV